MLILSWLFLTFMLLEMPLSACTRILCNSQPGMIVCGRSLDWHEPLCEALWLCPKGRMAIGAYENNAYCWQAKYNSISLVATRYGDAVVDGLNDVGLGAHLLYFDGACYEPRDQRPAISQAMWVKFLVDNFASVEELFFFLADVQIVIEPINGEIIPLHIAVEDRFGDSAILEFVAGQCTIHHGAEHTVMTNGPSYPHHIENLSHYFSFGGELAIPEGISSMDRFVRASFLLKHACPPNSSPAIVAFVFSLIRHMAVPFGTPFFNANSHPSPTWWTTVVDLSNCTYYYSSQLLPQVIWVDLQQVSWDELDDVYVIDPNDPTVYGAL